MKLTICLSIIILYWKSFLLKGVTASELPCSARDNHYEIVYSLPENSENGRFIGGLDIVGKATEPDQSIEFRTNVTSRNCVEISCQDLITLEPSSQDLFLNLPDGITLDRDGEKGIDGFDVVVTCRSLNLINEINVATLVHIKIIDENDNDPVFPTDLYQVEVNELTSIGSSVFTVTATDADKSSALSYRVVESSTGDSKVSAESYFEMPDPLTGHIVLKKKLDYEQLLETGSNKKSFTVEVIDVGGTNQKKRRATTTVEIEVKDGDDHPPQFSSCKVVSGVCVDASYTGFVQEMQMSLKPIDIQPVSLHAVDPDRELNQSIEYSLVGGIPENVQQYFRIESGTGEIQTAQMIPSLTVIPEFILYIKACQSNNELMCSIAHVHLKVVSTLEDQSAPVVLPHFALLNYVIHTVEEVAFLRSDEDNQLLHLSAYDNDDLGQKMDLTCDLEHFEITKDGFVVARTKEIASSGLTTFTLKIRASNPQAINASNQVSEAVSVQVLVKETDAAVAGTSSCCTPSPDFTAPFVVFLVLFLLCLAVIGYLIVKLRRYKALADNPVQTPYSISRTFEPKRNTYSHDNMGFREEPALYVNSVKSSKYGHVQSPPVDDDIPDIAPLGKHVKKKKENFSDEDLTSIPPYRSTSSLAHDWNTEDMAHTLSLKQIRVENWLSETDEKKCGVGEVNLGNPTPCFVKILKGQFGDKLSVSDDVTAMSHVLYFKSCDHPNLVKFYGSCLYKNSLYVVSEFVSSRDLGSVLVNSRTPDHSAVISTLSGAQLMNFSLGIAEALVYLHGNDVVHGGLCSKNVLINDRLTPKLYECCGENSKRLKLDSCRWTAPEVSVTHPYSEKSDIWSFGVVMWEILSLGGAPFEDLSEEKVPAFVRRQLTTGGTILPVTRNTTKRLWLLLQSCWAGEPSDRPAIAEIHLKLKRMKDASNAITVARAPGYHFFSTSTI